MCVIMTVEEDRPTRKELEAAADTNPHGAGIAWLEDGAVRFQKVGDDPDGVERIIELALTVPMPYVVHFRITSSGETTPELSHPFPIRTKKPLALSGTTSAVLFHNGTWREWREPLLAAAAKSGVALGDGPMSDTRAMAYLAAVLGRAVLKALPQTQKLAVLTSGGIRRYGDGWTNYAKGLWVSNQHWVGAIKGGPVAVVVPAGSVLPSSVKAFLMKGDVTKSAKSGR